MCGQAGAMAREKGEAQESSAGGGGGGVGRGLLQAEIPLRHLSGLGRRVYSLGSSPERRAGTHGHRILLGGKGYEDALHKPGDTALGSENAESYRPRGRQTLGDEG